MNPTSQTLTNKSITAPATKSLGVVTKESGFTLLEILITVGIMVALITVVIPRLGGRNQQIKGVVRKIGVLSREIRNQAKLKNSTYRLVIDMNAGDEGSGGQEKAKYSYWVEKSPGVVKGTQAEEEAEAAEKAKDDKDAPPPVDAFTPDTKLMKKAEVLPADMKFDRVEIASRKDAYTQGRVYIYYLPQGYVEESAIQLSYGDQIKWTIAIRGLTGRADIFQAHYSLKDVRPQ